MSYAEARVGLYDVVTPAVRIGPWVGRACVGLVAVGLIWALMLGLGQYRRTRRSAVRGRHRVRAHRQDPRMTRHPLDPPRCALGGERA